MLRPDRGKVVTGRPEGKTGSVQKVRIKEAHSLYSPKKIE
jgi:hypothetical protein